MIAVGRIFRNFGNIYGNAHSSCQKENIDVASNGGLRIITAEFENSATKTTLNADGKTPEWAVGDVIRILSSGGYKDVTLESGSGTPAEGKGYIENNAIVIAISATMTGDLYAVYPASATTMTSCTDGNITFTIPELQDGTFSSANICVAKEVTTSNLVFRNATAVLEITTADDVVGVDITAANNIAGPVTASFAGTTLNLTTSSLDKTFVSAVCKSAPSDNVFYLAAAPVSTGSTTATCYKIDKEGSTNKGDKELKRNVIYSMDLSSITIATDSDLTGKKGILNGHECVIIKAKYDGTNYSYLKWATMNIGVTTVAGSYTTCYGDLYQWGSVNALYDGFPWTSATGGNFTDKWKEGKDDGFDDANREYTSNDATLPFANDVARQKLGGTWRMPTSNPTFHP